MTSLRKKLSKIFHNRDSDNPTDKTKPVRPSSPRPELHSPSSRKSASNSPTKAFRRSPTKDSRIASAPISSLFDTLSDGFKWSASLLHEESREPAVSRSTQEDAKSPSQRRSRSSRWSATWSKSVSRSISSEGLRQPTSSEAEEQSVQSHASICDDSSTPFLTSAMAPALQVEIPDSVLSDLTADNHHRTFGEYSKPQCVGSTTLPGPVHVTFDEASLRQTSRNLLRRRSSSDDPFLLSESSTRVGTRFRQVGSAIEVRHPCGRAVYWCQCCKSAFEYSETAQDHTTSCSFQDQCRAKISIEEQSRAYMFRHPYEAAIDPFHSGCLCYKATGGRLDVGVPQPIVDVSVQIQDHTRLTGQAHSTLSEAKIQMWDDRWSLPSYRQSCQEASSLQKLSAEKILNQPVGHQNGIQQDHSNGGPVEGARFDVDNGYKIGNTSSTGDSTSSWGNSPTPSEGISSSTLLSTAPTMGSRSSWESARAERNKRYLALPSYDDETQSESECESSLRLQRCSPENNLQAPSKGLLRSSLSHAGMKYAVEAIRRASGFELDPDICPAESPFGEDVRFAMEAYERQCGLDLDAKSAPHGHTKRPNCEATGFLQSPTPSLPKPSSDDPYEAVLLAYGLSRHRQSGQGSPLSDSTIESLDLSAQDALAPSSLCHRFPSSSGPSTELSSPSTSTFVGGPTPLNPVSQITKVHSESTSRNRLSSPSLYPTYDSEQVLDCSSEDLLNGESRELSDSDSSQTSYRAVSEWDPLRLDVVERQTKELYGTMDSMNSINDEDKDDIRAEELCSLLRTRRAKTPIVDSGPGLRYGAGSSSWRSSESPVSPYLKPLGDITNHTVDILPKSSASERARSVSLTRASKLGFAKGLATPEEPACRRLFSNIDDWPSKDQSPCCTTAGNDYQQDNELRQSDEALVDNASSVYSQSVD